MKSFSLSLEFAFIMLILAFFSPSVSAQNAECGTNATAEDFKNTSNDLKVFVPPTLPALPATIPVIFYVIMKDDGTLPQPFVGVTVTEAQADAVLAQLSDVFSVNSNFSFTFQRCGKINYINNSRLQNGAMQAANYVYSPWAVNIIIDDAPGSAASDFPWQPTGTNNNIYLRGGYFLGWQTMAHEMGHSLGLLHTFEAGGEPYIVPTDPIDGTSQNDHPYNTTDGWPRELVIRDQDNTKVFKMPNHGGPPVDDPDDPKGGDLVKDTPAACDPGHQTGFPGCSFNASNCTYSGSYVDYNGMAIDDPSNVLAKNIMGYGTCKLEFTDGQLERAWSYYDNQRKYQFKPQWCGNMDDRVEYKGTSTGLGRVAIEFKDANTSIYNLVTKVMTSASGDFSGMLQPNQFGNFPISAVVKRLGPNPDFSFTHDNWMDGISVFELVLISKHILGVTKLNGYDQVAADVNHDNVVNISDVNLVRDLINGVIPTFPAYNQPWRFVRESVTLNYPGDFDGGGNDNPFQYPNLEGATTYQMTTGKQGFDAVKLGDVNGSAVEIEGYNGGGVTELGPPIYVDIVKQVTNGKSNYEFKVEGFQNIVAYQMDIKFPSTSLQFSAAQAVDLAGITDAFFGTGQAGQGTIKTLWYDATNASAFSLANGAGIFRLVFNGSTGQVQGDIQLAQNISYRSSDEPASMRCFAYSGDGTIRPIVQREYHRGTVVAIAASPNPFTTTINLTVDAVNEGSIRLQLFNMMGQNMHDSKENLSQGTNSLEIANLEHLPNGIYFAQIKSGGDSIVQKLIKKS